MKQNQFIKDGDNLIYEQNPVDNSLIDFNDKFLYHRDFADVYQKPDGRVYSVYTEDNLPTVTSNKARRNLEKPLWEHIQKQYARNPRGMKTIEDAVTWGGNVAGTSILAAGTAPVWLPYVAPAANMVGRVGKQALQGLDWLFKPTTYRGALLSSYVGAEGVNNFRKNPNIETGAQAALGLLPVIPAAINGARSTYNISKNLYNKGTLWDKYTTLGGRFGYYGNPLQRIYGTISRNLGLPSSPKHPELLRKLEGFPIRTDKGLLDFNSSRTELFGKGHSNWTLDRPVVSHNKGNWDGKDLFIVDPVEFQKAVPKENVMSIEPSDMFVQNADAFVDPRRVTLISGNPESLMQAKQMGMSTLSSPRLRKLYKPNKPSVGRFNLDKGNYGNRPYALEQQRLQQRRGTPTIKDFRLIEGQYGLNSGVIPMSEYLQNPLSSAINNMLKNPTVNGSWSYPNGREVSLIPGGTYLDKALYEESLINKAPYKNVFYDPASHVEVNSGVTNRRIGKNLYNKGTTGNKAINLVTPLSLNKIIKQKYVAPYMFSKILNRSIKANPKGQILVSESYFNSPDNWYRITNTPEVYGIKEVGKNVTTRDSGVLVDVPSDNWRTSVLESPLIRDKEGFLMLNPNRHNRSSFRSFQKSGSAHGNTSQASKGQIWQDGTSNSNIFPTIILEGDAARQVPMGITRTDFKLTPWEDIPMGQRIGFHTGEMPLDNLGYFQKLRNGKYSYQGTIIPYKRINIENY